MEAALLALVAAAGVGAAFIDSQVGGGGVISLPLLLALGIPPKVALGTNKLAGTGSSLMASIQYGLRGLVSWRQAAWYMPLAFAGAVLGVLAVLAVPESSILAMVFVIMVAMTAYVLVRPRFGEADRVQRPHRFALGAMALAVAAVGTYDGFLGPGTGSFLLFACVGLLGYGFRRAAALGRVLNFASNAGALAVFLARGLVQWDVGLASLGGMLVGAFVGSHTAIRHGDRYLKPLFVGVSLLLMATVLYRIV